jgi:hypothetical protein
MMVGQANWRCDLHSDPFDCPDALIAFVGVQPYGIIVHDGGSSSIRIDYCPWCGTRLSAPPFFVGLAGWFP